MADRDTELALGELAATVDDGATRTRDALVDMRRSVDSLIASREEMAELRRRVAVAEAEVEHLRAEAAAAGRKTLGFVDSVSGELRERPGRLASAAAILLFLAVMAREVVTVPGDVLAAGTAEVLHAIAERIAGVSP